MPERERSVYMYIINPSMCMCMQLFSVFFVSGGVVPYVVIRCIYRWVDVYPNKINVYNKKYCSCIHVYVYIMCICSHACTYMFYRDPLCSDIVYVQCIWLMSIVYCGKG